MPITESGVRVEMIVDINGVGGRLNGKQLAEVELNYYKYKVIDQMKEMDSLEEKENHLFKFLEMAHEPFCKKVSKFYNTLDLDEKENFIQGLEDDPKSFSLEQPPMYGNLDLDGYDRIANEFNIKPEAAYIQKFGRRIKLMNDVIVGDKYIYKLKHHPKGKFSARSTSFINSKDQPTKAATTKQNKAIYQTTALKVG